MGMACAVPSVSCGAVALIRRPVARCAHCPVPATSSGPYRSDSGGPARTGSIETVLLSELFSVSSSLIRRRCDDVPVEICAVNEPLHSFNLGHNQDYVSNQVVKARVKVSQV